MKNFKRLILFVLVGVLALSTLVLSACGGGLDHDVSTVEVKVENVTINGDVLGCVVAYGKTDSSVKNYGFKVIYSNGTEKLFPSSNIDSNGNFSAQITGLPEGTYSVRAYIGDAEKFGQSLAFDALVDKIDSVSLSLPSMNLFVDQTYELKATFTPENTIYRNVVWTSSNEDVATVENGVVKGLKKGTARIRATVKDKYKECIVNVKEVVNVSFAESGCSLFVGEVKTLTPSFSAGATDTTLTWTSQDESVARVDQNGKITAVGLGETNVYATTVSGNRAYCHVRVEGEFTITLSAKIVVLDKGSSTSIGVTVDPETVIERGLVWGSEDESVVKVDQNGKITAVGSGTTYVYADINGVRDLCEVTVKDEYMVEFILDGETYSIRYTGKTQNYKVKVPVDPADHDTTSVPFIFEGWYLDSSFTKALTANTTFNADSKVYAKTTSIYDYEILNNRLYITGLKSKYKGEEDIVIPKQIAGIPVYSIYYEAFRGASIKSVHIDAGLVEILDDAFRDCDELDTVTFDKKSTLKKIGDSAFRNCPALSSFTLPFSITGANDSTVGELCFYGSKNVSYGEMFSFNLQKKQYYSNKYVYEFMGDDTMFIGGYIEPSVGYFADYVSLESVIKDWVDSGTNTIIGIGQARWGTTATHYNQMLEYLEKYGGMMLVKGGFGQYQSTDESQAVGYISSITDNYINKYASYAGFHVEDEPGVSSWVPGLGEYSQYNKVFNPSHMQYTHEIWKNNLTRKLYYVNLLPVNSPIKAFAWGADNYNYKDNLDKLWASYEQYANYDYYYETYIKYVKPELFSYDFYPLWANGGPGYLQYPTLNQRHFEQLYKTYYYVNDYAMQELGHTIPFWNFVQVTSWGNSWGGGSREATYRELVWQINTAFAFGSKGYQYFVFTDYGDITGGGKPSDYDNCPMNIDGTKGEAYDDVKTANTHSQGMAKWLLNADVDHIYMHGENPSGEIMPEEILKTKKPGYDWAFESSSGAANLVSHMTYVANNNEYVEGVPADERELYFVCNNGTQPHEDGAITVNFDRTVSGSYIFGGVEKTFTGKTLTVDTKAGEGFAILLNK